MRRRSSIMLIVVAAASGIAVAPAEEYDSPGCAWGRPTDPDVVNVFYPDEGATYWAGRAPLPPGSRLELHGTFPHARYLSFNAYDEQLAPVDALADIDIAPDPGSTNPFHAGADRTAAARAYTVTVLPGPAPAERAPNTLYASVAGQGGPYVNMLYRVYVPDDGRDIAGDTGLPTVDLITADGTVVHLTPRCDPAQATSPVGSQLGGVPLQEQFTDGALPSTPLTTAPASDPLRWEKFFNLPHVQLAVPTYGTPLRPFVDEALGTEMGGYLSNAHNAYVVSIANRGFGPVLLLRGRAPTVPHTRDGRATMEPGQLRYWSLCTNERHTTRWIDCVVDEEAAVEGDGFVTFVVSAPEDRPANATEACGINWLAWGTSPETLLILRHMLPAPDFDQAIQNVARPDQLEDVVGDYLPAGHHTTTAAVEALGCRAA